MALPSEDDQDAIDRAFEELVARYHLTAARPDSLSPDLLSPDSLSTETADEPTLSSHDPDVREGSHDPDAREGAANWAADHPLFGFVQAPADTPTPAEEPTEERYVPEPLPPLQRPAIPALLGWIGIGYAIVIVLAATLGVRFPTWAGWVAVGSFVGGFGILMTRLPKERPPGAGDGAVL
jgi:hypothetical protein